MRVVLYNDTSLINSHFGPQLVTETVRHELAQRGAEIVGSLQRDALPSDHRALFDQADLVIVNGEGSIHHGRCQHLVEIARQYPAALINVVYQENPCNDALAAFRFIAARESRSAEHLQECGARRVEIVPDLMFAAPTLRHWNRGAPTLDLAVTDNVMNREAGFPPFVDRPDDYLRWLSQHRRIVCGRYHAAVACCALGIPFTCWPSNTWKIEGMLEDIGRRNLCFASQELAIRRCPTSFDDDTRQCIQDYVADARQRIELLFDELCAGRTLGRFAA